jgi:eukaryotic-like serine/threonine-protein kinase
MAIARIEPGVVIDRFRLEERIHQGSMATLWRVTGEVGQPPMVMKMPQLREGDDPTAMVGFEVERMIMPTLSGVHVPRFIAAADFPEQAYIVMELLPGQSLRARIDEAPLPPAELARVGVKVAAALHDVHSQHVIHLDLKPSNVMFRESGEAVLIDFGFSRHDRLPDLLAEQFRLPMGTGPYISPEQVLHIRNDPRSDLFALGVLLYHLSTGTRPFGNPTNVRGLRQRLYRDPVPPRALLPDFPPWLQEILLRCLEADPRKRYDTAAQVAFELQHPEQVMLTARSERLAQDGVLTVARRWFRIIGAEADPRQSAAGQLARAPIVMAAIDVTQTSDALVGALRVTARRVLETEPGARLACVTVLRTRRLAIDTIVDGEGSNLRVKRLVELKHWARPLGIPPERITFHVLEGPDPARTLIEFASTNQVDQIVIGSRGSSSLRRYLGSVSAQVVAEAECTVTVVKAAESVSSGQSDRPAPMGG